MIFTSELNSTQKDKIKAQRLSKITILSVAEESRLHPLKALVPFS
jgi:hypothetical protein